MSTSPLVANYGAIATFTGAAFPIAFADPAAGAVRKIAQSDACTGWARITTDAASNFTSVDVQIVDSYDGSAGSWIPNYLQGNASSGTVTGTSTATLNVTLSLGATIWIKLQTPNTEMGLGGASVRIRGNGGAAKSGDSVTLYLVTTEGQ